MATVEIILKMVDQTSTVKNKTVAGLKEMASALTSLTAVAVGVGLAMKKAFDLGKEGAMLEFTATKFDRLAESIGTTSEALLTDLKEATRGTYSDMELIASATDLVSLGLAKTHDEAVRLATVSAGLNMDMNQLVLTLTNMTTMRFDALGVSTDGFKDKLKELEAQGYSTDEAFREAFLQQAEMQLEKVGNAADTSLGSFMRLEAQWKNAADTAKRDFAQGMEGMVDALADSLEEHNKYREILQKINPELDKQLSITGRITPQMRALVEQYESAQQGTDGWMASLDGANESVKDLTNSIVDEEAVLARREQALKLQKEAIDALSDANKSYLSSISDITSDLSSYEEKHADIQQQLNDGTITLGEAEAAWKKLADEQEIASRRMILSMLEQQLAVDGLTELETNYLLQLGLKWGVYSAEAVQAMKEAQNEVRILKGEFESLPTEKTFTYYVNQVGEVQGIGGYSSNAPQLVEKRARGGSVSGGKMYEVTENDVPELLSMGNKDFLMMPSGQSGYVTPIQNNSGGGGSGGITKADIQQLIYAVQSTRMDEATLARVFRESALQVAR